MKQILVENGVLDPDVVSIESRLKESILYGDVACQRLQVIAAHVFSDGEFERIHKVIGRIRNDQHVKNALRPQQLSVTLE